MGANRNAVFYGVALLVLAVLARLGLADRDAVIIIALVLPLLAVISIYRDRGTSCI
jgi:hypothetical protein